MRKHFESVFATGEGEEGKGEEVKFGNLKAIIKLPLSFPLPLPLPLSLSLSHVNFMQIGETRKRDVGAASI